MRSSLTFTSRLLNLKKLTPSGVGGGVEETLAPGFTAAIIPNSPELGHSEGHQQRGWTSWISTQWDTYSATPRDEPGDSLVVQ